MPTRNKNRDPLTGVANWKYVSGILPGILGHNGQVALILVDIDRFKVLNDRIGPGRGDLFLKKIAQEIEKLSGENSLIFRIGGDEFGVILYEASLETAREVAETIRANRTSTIVESNGKEIETLTLSLGIAHFPTHVSNAENLLAAAELALLKTKQNGRFPDGTPYTARNRVMAIGDFFDDFPEQSARFLQYENESTAN